MNICKRCGKENQEHYKFCLGCGGELTSATAASAGGGGAGGGGGAQKTIMASALGPLPGVTPAAQQPQAAAPPLRMPTPTPPAGMAAQPPPGMGMSPPPLAPPPLGPPPQLGGGGAPGRPPSAGFNAPTPPANYGAAPLGGSPNEGRTMMAGQGLSPPPGLGNFPPPGGGGGQQNFPPPGGSPNEGRTMMAGQGLSPPPGLGNFPPPGGGQPLPPPYSPPPPQQGFSPSPQSSPFGGPGGSPPFTPVSAPMPVGGPASNQSVPILGVAPPGVTAGGATRNCPNCGTEVPASFMFCGACGTRLEPLGAGPGMAGAPARTTGDMQARVAPAPEPKPHGRLTLIRPDGSEGGVHDLDEGENQIGRQHGALFENDGYLSPRHAELIINAAGAVIRDLGSLNGVFVKMTGEEELQSGDVFRIGQELLRFDSIPAPQPLEDGTEVMGSPNPGYWGRLSVIIGKDIDGSAYPLFGDSVGIGRERGDINFPDDGYVSGLHARITYRDGKCFITDLGSSNGTFCRLRGDRVVQDGAFVLFGQQLFRVNLNVG